MEPDFYTDVKLLTHVAQSLDDTMRAIEDPEELLFTNLIAFAAIEEARRNLAITAGELEQRLAKVMPRDLVVKDVGTFECRKKKSRTQWDRETLVRDVQDSRLVNPETGEVKDETPLEKVLAVWNLGAPRLTVLRERGLDPEDYCHSEDAGYSIRLVS